MLLLVGDNDRDGDNDNEGGGDDNNYNKEYKNFRLQNCTEWAQFQDS